MRRPTLADQKLFQSVEAITAQEDHTHPDHYFFSLVRPYEEPKLRRCLRCKDYMKSKSRGHRVCAKCSGIVQSALRV